MVATPGGPALKTEPQSLLVLLEIQTADLKMQRLVGRRDSLPESAKAKELAAAAAAARDREVMRRTEVSDLQREVRKLEDEVDRVRARAKRDAELLASGDVPSARVLTDLQHEIASLQRRQSDLEDAELELLEQLDTAQQAQREAAEARDRLGGEAEQASVARDEAMSALANEYRQTAAHRKELAAGVPSDLLELYDRIRAEQDGIGAAEFTTLCGACGLQMTPPDAAAVRAAPLDEVVRCEECRRILVRTALLR